MLKQLMMYPMVQRTKSSYKSAKSSKHPYLIGIAAFIATSIAANWCTAEERNTSKRIRKASQIIWDRHSIPANDPCEDGSCGRLMRFSMNKPKKSRTKRWNMSQNEDTTNTTTNDILVTSVFDGHGGAKAMMFLKKHFLSAFEAIAEEIFEESRSSQNVVDVIKTATSLAFAEADVAFETEALECVLKGQWGAAQVGACVLMACTTDSNIVVANAGDCRALLAVRDETSNKLRPCQISNDHNAREKVEKLKLREAHPDEPNVIVEYANNVAYVKGALQTTRSIGDFNLKSKMFNNALPPVYRIDKPYTPPYITAVPEIHVLSRDGTQEYLILGTDGLFDELSNEEVVEIVDKWHEKHKDEEGGGSGSLSQHLTNIALGNAARDIGVSVLDLSRIPEGARRRNLHDDITVVVVRLS